MSVPVQLIASKDSFMKLTNEALNYTYLLTKLLGKRALLRNKHSLTANEHRLRLMICQC